MDSRIKKTQDAYNAIAKIYEQDFGNDNEFFDLFVLPVAKGLSENKLSGHIVDLGSGPGNVVDYLVSTGVTNEIVAVDFASRFCDLLRKKYVNNPRIEVVEGDMIAFVEKQAADSISAYVANYSLIHVPDEDFDSFVKSVYRSLQPGGYLSLAVWGGNTKQMELEPYQVQHDPRLHNDVILESYLNNFSENELLTRLKSAGFIDIFLKTFQTEPLPGEFNQPKIIGYAKKSFSSNS
jgi:SAM-dependent methyltransferase